MNENKSHLGGCYSIGDANTIMPDVWGWLTVNYNIKSILDVGCGYGHSMVWFEKFMIDCIGIDGFEAAINNRVCSSPIILHDYNTGNLNLSKQFDLGWSSEFLEHVDEKYLPFVFDTFLKCNHVCMTHAWPNQDGYHHVNCQSDEYWVETFVQNGFLFDTDNTKKLRLTDRWSAGWGRNSLMLFHKNI